MPEQTPLNPRKPNLHNELRAEQRRKFLETIKVGDKRVGRVKNITDYGVFVDLGGGDGLVHRGDLSWEMGSQPSELFQIGQSIAVKILEINPRNGHIKLGIKQLLLKPWDNIESLYPVGGRFRAKVTHFAKYSVFVTLQRGVQGRVLLHEISWSKRLKHASEVLVIGQEIDVVVLGIKKDQQYLMLGMRQLMPNPWDGIDARHPVGSRITRPVHKLIGYGAFVEVEEGINGMVHVSDLSWTRTLKRPSDMLELGQQIEVVVLDIDKDGQRIKLGMKQLQPDPWLDMDTRIRVGDIVKVCVSSIGSYGIFVRLLADLEGFIHKSQLNIKPGSRVEDVFQVGEEVEARIITVDPEKRRISLSITAMDHDP